MATITISRQFGAGGRTLGERLANRLGYYYVDEIMVKEVAERMRVSSRQVLGFEKEGASALMKILRKFVVSDDYISRLVSDKYGYVVEKKYVEAVTSIVRGLHGQGNVVILGRGSQYILKGKENSYHVLLLGEMEDRIRFIMDIYQLTEEEAKQTINRADKNRANFLRFFSDKELHDDPLSYDLTLNMSRVDMGKAENLVVDLISG
jgi:cytidylate kinase